MPNYYTLSSKGAQWTEGVGSDPSQYDFTLAALAELQEESSTPQTVGQIAKAAEESSSHTEAALDLLDREGFVITSSTITVEAEGRRIPRTLEEIEESYQRELAASAKYSKSIPGRASRRRYWQGKGRLRQREWQKTDKGLATASRAAERLKKRIVVTPLGLQHAQTSRDKLSDSLRFILLEKAIKDEVEDEVLTKLREKQFIL